MPSDLTKKRKRVHHKVVHRFSEGIATLTAFLVIFSTLLTLSNWPAYSRIIQDMIDPQAMAHYLETDQELDLLEEKRKKLQKEVENSVNPDFAGENLRKFGTASFLNAFEEMYPHEMRLEVPKVFAGSIPVGKVDIAQFDFKDLYESENKIQQALRDGAVHYPYTSDPDQYGNVFITAHSSYLPWDGGKFKEIFALLHKLEVGDEYYIYFEGKKYTYKVRDKFEIQPDDVSVLKQPEDDKVSTLMTCTPVGTTLRRLIVQADLVEERP